VFLHLTPASGAVEEKDEEFMEQKKVEVKQAVEKEAEQQAANRTFDDGSAEYQL
jgi:hypothetical protein